MKKTIACLILACLLLHGGWAQTLTNPGFETGDFSSWTIPAGATGTPQVIASNAYSGTYAAQLSGGVCSIEQVVPGFDHWQRYTLTAWVKLAHAGDTATLGVKNYNGAATVSVKITGTAYTPYSLTFYTGGGTITTATIYLSTGNASTIAYADDFSVALNPVLTRSTYYIDNMNGNDSNNGLSAATAWQTLAKVNATTFFPGDSILFKYNGLWIGTDSTQPTLHPLGEGAPGRPIVISRYGGTAARPIINGKGATRTVYLSNQEYWEITNLEVTNTARFDSLKRGIEVENINRGKLTHIRIANNNVHDIYGNTDKGQNGSAGIMLVVGRGTYNQTPSWFDSVWIENNIVKNVRRTGITTSSDWRCKPEWGCTTGIGYYPTTNMIIRNNYVENVIGDGIVPMVAYGTLVEHNMVNKANASAPQANAGIWCWGSVKTLFQYNEVYNVKRTNDGEGYDVDTGQDSTVFQYNYSHDNEGGFMLLCANVVGTNKHAVVRYNISQNEKYRIFMINGCVDSAEIYNNTLYLPPGSIAVPLKAQRWVLNLPFPSNISMRNNIFYLASAGNWIGWQDSITGAKVFDNNIVYGAHTSGEPAGNNNLTVDPLLDSAGTGTTGSLVNGVISFGTVNGYKLKNNSPAIGAGVLMPGNGGKDYWGNPVSATNPPNIGADNSYASLAAGMNTKAWKNMSVIVYPNPVKRGQVLNTLVSALQAGRGNYEIVDVTGRLVYYKQVALNAGPNLIQTALPSISAGVYFVKISKGIEQTVYRFVTE